VLELALVFCAVEVAFRFCDQTAIIKLPMFVAADSDAFSGARLLLRKETLTEPENPCSMEVMKIKTVGLTVALCFFAGAACFADDPQMGTWKLNEAKSKLTPDAGKNTTVVYEAAGDQVKVVIDGTDKDGKPTHNEWTGKLDGKDYAVTGDPKSDMRAYKKIDDHTLAFTVKKDGKTTATGRIVVAADGKSRMVTARGADEQGKKSKDKAAYDKQ
jgi:hypothetical protein